jgi:S-adenosylmethionine/arginine decarboxylase-like enzyme
MNASKRPATGQGMVILNEYGFNTMGGKGFSVVALIEEPSLVAKHTWLQDNDSLNKRQRSFQLLPFRKWSNRLRHF